MSERDGPFSILLVEQDPEVNELFQQMLEAMGYEVHATTSPMSALEYARTRAPSVVFTSLVFYGSINGFELCSELRNLPQTESSLIVALTGLSYDGVEEIAKATGFDHYFLKPIGMDMLMKIVALIETEKNKPAVFDGAAG